MGCIMYILGSIASDFTVFTAYCLLGCFTLIFYLDCKHFFFVYIVKQRQKNLQLYKKKFRRFSKFNRNRVLLEANFLILIIHKPFLGHVRSHKNLGRLVEPYCRLLDITNHCKQTRRRRSISIDITITAL